MVKSSALHHILPFMVLSSYVITYQLVQDHTVLHGEACSMTLLLLIIINNYWTTHTVQ